MIIGGRVRAFMVAAALGVPALVATQQGPPPMPYTPPGFTNLKEFMPLAHARFFGDAELVLLNNGPAPVEVTPRWLLPGRGLIPGEKIMAKPNVPEFIPLRQMLPPGVTLSDLEGLEVAYQGRAVMHVSAQVTLLPLPGAQPNQSLDVPPTIPVDTRGARLEAVWAAPRHDEQAFIVVANLTWEQRTVAVTRPTETQRLSMGPWSVQTLTFPSREARGVDWLRLEGDDKGIRATGFVMSAADRIPHLIRFYDPKAAARAGVWTNGLRLGDPSLAVLLKNTLDVALQAKARLMDPADGAVLVDFADLNLAPGAGAALDLGPLARASLGARVGVLRVNSSGPAGSLVGSVQTVDAATGLQHDAPLRDSGWDNTSYRRRTGSCAWRLDGDYNTRVTITNVGDAETAYSAVVRVSTSEYIAGMRKLAPGASVTFDLRQLRDEQARDGLRRTLPLDAERGQCHWSALSTAPGNAGLLMGRAEIVSLSRRVSSTHSW